MRDRPTFAVVIPTYDRSQRLLRTLETVFAQDEPPAEIIIVDNCSPDDTSVVVGDLAATHPEIRFIRHDKNLERAASRNTGMSNATADYVTLLDSDDRMYPQNLREAGDFVVDTGAKFFHNRYHSVDDAGRHIRNWPTPRLANQLRAIAVGNFPSCIGVFIHREIYRTYRFDTNPLLTGSEDYDLWLRIVADHKMHRINRVNSAIVQHAERTMVTQDLGIAHQRIEYLLDKVFSDPHLAELYAPYRRLMRASRMVFLAGIANDNHDSKAAMEFLRRAVTEKPTMSLSPRFIRCMQMATANWLRRRQTTT